MTCRYEALAGLEHGGTYAGGPLTGAATVPFPPARMICRVSAPGGAPHQLTHTTRSTAAPATPGFMRTGALGGRPEGVPATMTAPDAFRRLSCGTPAKAQADVPVFVRSTTPTALPKAALFLDPCPLRDVALQAGVPAGMAAATVVVVVGRVVDGGDVVDDPHAARPTTAIAAIPEPIRISHVAYGPPEAAPGTQF